MSILVRSILLMLFTALAGCATTPREAERAEPATAPEQEPSFKADVTAQPLRITLVGDIMLGGTATEFMERHGYDYAFAGVANELARGDVVFGNLEGPLTDGGEPFPDKQYRFRTPPAKVAPALARAGFDVVSLANNHALDYGLAGLFDTQTALADAGIEWVGAGIDLARARRAAIVEAAGRRVGFLAYSNTFPEAFWATPTQGGTAFGHRHQIEEDVARLRERADVVVVSFHWGREATTELRPYQPLLAHAAIDAGADVNVPADHPSAVRPLHSAAAGGHSEIVSLLLRLLFVGLLGSAVGVGVGWIAQAGLVGLIGDWFDSALPAPSAVPVVVGILTGLITLSGFGLVPALRIRRVPVMRVLHRAHAPPEPSVFAAIVVALVTVAGLIVYQADDLELAGNVLAGTVGMLAALGLAAVGLVALVRRFHGERVTGWRFGLASLARRPQTSSVQLVGFGLGLLALLLLAVVRLDVLNAWQRNLPEDTPDQFMINVQPADVDEIERRLAANGIDVERFYPMSRARLIEINGQAPDVVQGDDPDDDFDQDQGRRGVNMSYAGEPRGDNPIVAGDWWAGDEQVSEFSVEQGFAERTGINLGDELLFRVGGEQITGTVSNLRKVDWDTFRVNFFVIASPSVLEDMPSTWITSFWLPPGKHDAISGILRDYPGVTVIDVGQIINQVRTVVEQGTRAVEYVFAFSLLAGLIVLIAAVQASRDQRRTEIAILRTHGASRRRVRAMLLTEFATLGGLAGSIAAIGALVTGWAITTRVLDIPWQLSPEILLIGIGGGAAGIALAGLLATRHLLAERPMAVLRSE